MLRKMCGGFGMLGLASVLSPATLLAATRQPHFAPRAKRIIFLFHNGGPSHVDTFDPKPMLLEHQGQQPEGRKSKGSGFMPSPYAFNKYGQSGIEVCETLPLLGDVIGVDVDFGRAPGFFQTGDQGLVQRSSVTTFTGNVVIAPPRHLTEYTLGPYFVLGAGVMRARSQDFNRTNLSVASNLPAMDVGGGANGFLSDRIGLNWDVRYFWSVGGKELGGIIGPEQLSFWRASMGLVIRYK